MKLFKNLVLALFFVALSSCGAYQYTTAKKESDEATKEQQEEVKLQVMKLLEEEYKQPFKLENFSYKYERHWVDSSCQMSFCEMEKYGTYSFKAVATENNIIVLDFDIKQKDSLKDSIESFKDKHLKRLFCGALGKYYSDNYSKPTFNKISFDKNAKYCDERGDSEDYQFYVKYMSK